jgi:predicted acyl esterase
MDHWDLLTPNEIYEIMIDLGSTAYIWNKGHQIRVDISSSNFPRFLINSNNGLSISSTYFNPSFKTANNNIYICSDHPSSIIFPIIEVKDKSKSDYEYISSDINQFIIEFLFERFPILKFLI